MKHLKTALLCASLALAAAAQAAGNPHRESYGTWEETLVKNGQASAERFVIATHGFEEFAKIKAGCDKRKKGYVHNTDRTSGRELAKSIRASIEDQNRNGTKEEAEAYSAPLQEALAKISADKKYLRVNLSLSCADGAMSFIQLDRNDGLKMYAAPDVYHFPVKRVQ